MAKYIRGTSGILLFSVILGVMYFLMTKKKEPEQQRENTNIVRQESPREEAKEIVPVIPEPVVQIPISYEISVPFTVQAPYGEWSDPIFQDACEEASVVMAAFWMDGIKLTKESAKNTIETLAKLQKKKFGHSVDTSIEDTAWLFRELSPQGSAAVERKVTIERMKAVLAEGNILILPTDGRALKNPNFTQPGPSRHMLVVTGHDDTTKEFIVNDPGTRKGERYRYAQSVLFDAILDYPTGKHAPVTSTDKVMLIVESVRINPM